MALNPEDEKYYQTMFDLTSHDGWLELQKDAKEKMEAIKESCVWETDPLKVAEMRGVYQVWYSLLHMRDGLESGLEQAKAEQDHEYDTL